MRLSCDLEIPTCPATSWIDRPLIWRATRISRPTCWQSVRAILRPRSMERSRLVTRPVCIGPVIRTLFVASLALPATYESRSRRAQSSGVRDGHDRCARCRHLPSKRIRSAPLPGRLHHWVVAHRADPAGAATIPTHPRLGHPTPDRPLRPWVIRAAPPLGRPTPWAYGRTNGRTSERRTRSAVLDPRASHPLGGSGNERPFRLLGHGRSVVHSSVGPPGGKSRREEGRA